MSTKISIALLVVLVLLGVGALYVKDSATVEQARLVERYLRDYCQENNSYPDVELLKKEFPALYPNEEWYYWINEEKTNATFQYPMTLPLPTAPGASKISEFMPIIYAYAVRHPCHDLIN